MCTKFWQESLQEKRHSDDLSIDEREYYSGFYGNKFGRCELDLSGSEQQLVVGSCKYV
jgi:hypothetical protein